MAQRANITLVENLRPFIVRIATQAIGTRVSQGGESGGYTIYYDRAEGTWHKVFMRNGQLYREVASSASGRNDESVRIETPILIPEEDKGVPTEQLPVPKLDQPLGAEIVYALPDNVISGSVESNYIEQFLPSVEKEL